jgi:hypothetical protein
MFGDSAAEPGVGGAVNANSKAIVLFAAAALNRHKADWPETQVNFAPRFPFAAEAASKIPAPPFNVT